MGVIILTAGSAGIVLGLGLGTTKLFLVKVGVRGTEGRELLRVSTVISKAYPGFDGVSLPFDPDISFL